MLSESTEAVRQSSSQLWLVAGIPTLLILAFLIYTAVSQSRNSGATTDSALDDTSQQTPGKTSPGEE